MCVRLTLKYLPSTILADPEGVGLQWRAMEWEGPDHAHRMVYQALQYRCT